MNGVETIGWAFVLVAMLIDCPRREYGIRPLLARGVTPPLPHALTPHITASIMAPTGAPVHRQAFRLTPSPPGGKDGDTGTDV